MYDRKNDGKGRKGQFNFSSMSFPSNSRRCTIRVDMKVMSTTGWKKYRLRGGNVVLFFFTRHCFVVIGCLGLAEAVRVSFLAVRTRGRAGDGDRRCGGRSERGHGERGGDGRGGRCCSCNV